MLTLHHLETSRSHRILWLLEELGVPYTLMLYQRDPKTRAAPAELKAIHPLGKSPVLTDGDQVIAESAAIIEYLAERYATGQGGELATLVPATTAPTHLPCRYWMHYTEGSLMNWLLMKLVFINIPQQPMPFFVRPIARKLCAQVLAKLVNPNLASALTFIEQHLSKNIWFAGSALTIADFQMSYAVEALLARSGSTEQVPHLRAYGARMRARPAYQRALAAGGPVIPAL